MTIFGQRSLWAIEVDPLSGAPLERDPAAAATWCSIKIWADGRNLTAHTHKQESATYDALRWPAVYLARWFVRSWPGFWERAGWPLPGAIVDAEVACRRLDQHLAELGLDVEEEMLDRRDEFVASHSLLAAAAGGLMPHIYLMKEGSSVHLTWREPTPNAADVAFLEPQGRARFKSDVFLDAVIDFLDWCRNLVVDHDPELASEIKVWQTRIDRPEAAGAVLRGYIRPWGVPAGRSVISEIDSRLEIPGPLIAAGALFDPARLSAAVLFRALAPVLSAEDVWALMDRLQSYPSDASASRRLEELRSKMVVPTSEPPHQQGYQLAEQFRNLRNNPDGYFDVEAFLEEIGVQLDIVDLSDKTVDGATIWGERHGPVVVVNQLGPRQAPWARRMILAHELCHLLVDRQSAAELMVASTPWAPPELERRANAFAAELLLPRAGILRLAGEDVRNGWVGEGARVDLMEEFQVGAMVCDHQLENRLRISDQAG